MPQMAVEALSENWLFKELGDLHWNMLCDGLKTPSFHLKDELGNRLYATFVRIRIQSTISLNEFKESEELEVNGSMKRYGNGMYFSNTILNSKNGKIEADLMTSFSIRNDTDNTKLMKSEPFTNTNSIPEYDNFPLFGNDYRLIKKEEINELTLGGNKFKIQDEIIFKVEYELNPYYDLNGVGLLYFAAYPIINEVCEAKYFNSKKTERWEQNYYTISRDIFYFANCNINDTIEYKLNFYEYIDGNKIKISSSLFRKSDSVLMARIFTIKQKKQ